MRAASDWVMHPLLEESPGMWCVVSIVVELRFFDLWSNV
jgi:hypothetical protein